ARHRLKVKCPSQLKVFREESRLRLQYPIEIKPTVRTLLWIVTLLLFLALILVTHLSPWPFLDVFDIPIVIQLAMLLLWICLYLLLIFAMCTTIASLIKRAEIVVEQKQMFVQYVPLPLRRWNVVQTKRVDQLFVRENWPRAEKQHDVVVRMVDGEEKRWFTGLKLAEHALYIEQEIEAFLGIQDKPMHGEWSHDV
ncbi:MAG: hypothetical protein ACPG8W_09805, partial [Candidatus Promineifilaceae bacterium]